MGDLERDTQVTGCDGRYAIELDRDWEIWGPNGGYIAAIALRAAGAHSRFDRPASIVANFLGVATFDVPLDIAVVTTRAAKRAEAMKVSLTQSGQPIFDAMVWAVGDVAGLEHDVTDMPEAPEPETLPTVAERLAADDVEPGPYHRFWSNFDERVPDDDWITDWENRPPRAPEFGHWYRYVPASTFADPWVDACRSLILVDTLGWPAVCQMHPRNAFVAPSIDLACAFHRTDPDEPWLYARTTAASAAGGLVGCESRVWSRRGTLLAHGTSQLLCRPAPPAP
jgi:acyl-CoA thioesterase-2